jgi:Macro domain
MPPTAVCLAGAVSTARFTGPPARDCWSIAGLWGDARRVKPESRPLSGFPPAGSFIRSDPSGTADRGAKLRCLSVVTGKACSGRLAFPAISTGVYGYPASEAADIALTAMRAHERDFDMIIACCYSAQDAEIYRARL